MGFSKMLGLLQIKDKGYIILANAGNFYLARGKDALLLNEILGLKLSCMETEICKVGFPINSLEIKYYCRYLDDSIVIVKTKQEAKQTLIKITEFLRNNLKLELNRKTQIFKNKQGVNFCGYKINEYRLKIRDKGKRKLKKKIKKLKQEIKEGKITSKEVKKYLAGHMGYIKIADVKNLTDKLFYKEE